MFVGIGLDSNEYDRPPLLFKELYKRARADGFKLTAHCDVTQKDTHEHIRQVVEELGGTGAERVDHGLDAAERSELVEKIRERGVGMTLCEFLSSSYYDFLKHAYLSKISKHLSKMSKELRS